MHIRPALLAAIAAGVVIGIGAFTFGYARGHSYLTNDPAACANCHIMADHFTAWLKSSHRAVAVCNDCHAPHDLVGKYSTKLRNGFWHSFYFTTGRFPYPLRITARNHDIVEHACRDCHEHVTESIEHGASEARDRGKLACTRCHVSVGHWVR